MADETSTNNETTTITLPTLGKSEAKVILDWDDGQWYLSEYSSIDAETGEAVAGQTSSASDGSAGVKLAVWDKDYKYVETDIVAFEGELFVSKQNTNQGNTPNAGTFWWGPVVDFSNIDSLTLEGRNLQEIIKDVLGGNDISEYYKKTETNNLVLSYFNNVNAKKLGDYSLENITEDYEAKIATAKQEAQDYSVDYLIDDGNNSYQQTLVDEFNNAIIDDQVNQRN